MRHYVACISTGGVQSFLLFSFVRYTLRARREYTNFRSVLSTTIISTHNIRTYMDHFASPNGQAPLGNGGSPSPRHIIRLGRMTKMYVPQPRNIYPEAFSPCVVVCMLMSVPTQTEAFR